MIIQSILLRNWQKDNNFNAKDLRTQKVYFVVLYYYIFHNMLTANVKGYNLGRQIERKHMHKDINCNKNVF